MKKKITIKDIAKAANVSVTTVSFVLNDKGEKMGISKEVIKKVIKVSEEMKFKLNMIASSLRTGKTRSIGLIVEDISNQFFSDLARVIEREAIDLNYRVFYCSTGGNDERAVELVNSLLQANVDGFIITPTENMKSTIDRLLELQCPVVLVDRYFEEQDVSHVVLDNFEGAETATHYLLKKGFRKIAFVTNSSQLIQMSLRKQGYTKALKEVGLYDESKILDLEYHISEEERIEKISDFLSNTSEIDAVLFGANYLLLAGLQSLSKLGLKIPVDKAVISFDDHDSFRLHSPSITVLSQPIEEMGKKTIKLLMKQMSDGSNYKVVKEKKKGSLTIRESV
ncbi:LacI family DNA-binding transcriptional regulator [Flavobacterium plurextorum]|uniref:LacI family transcriptional regulator n=1 Tax=Flavobacterium plurextorum TaxID=1114867 RepID=A0ABX4CZ97_9FLAO|nr:MULTISPECIES: LacI family DNA-binding transcriptional regulator [Flavobacterium]OXB11233.1 LacI family transcriptional regulator [Flavobacterium plurextorum]PIF70766.1 LacI family transcriptional regulator [Flavobacterium sp. 2]UUW07968.1 LacI family transcriptional regulator [Flavobacterium plurextorum]